MNALRKIRNNLFSAHAVSVLTPVQYSKYLLKFVENIPEIFSIGDLRPLDKAMGASVKQFHYRGSTFNFDCNYCDELLRENSFSFGIAREIYIRDCYFKWLPPSVYDNAKTVIDLGANRGAFSALMTTRARFILSVECQEKYLPAIKHNMSANDFTKYAVEAAFVGTGGAVSESGSPSLTLDELFQRHNIETVDMMKLDIEGSEFALFASPDWLQRVNALSMEVHPSHGNPGDILMTLAQNGFSYEIADENLQQLSRPDRASFIYAWKTA
ncbi:MAG: FkbM family methyltransferase [Geobacteraceae bacterium]|nr:FkbM family methyltransferase [Geobacteraceae bacterium]